MRIGWFVPLPATVLLRTSHRVRQHNVGGVGFLHIKVGERRSAHDGFELPGIGGGIQGETVLPADVSVGNKTCASG